MTKFAHDAIVPDNNSRLNKKQQVATMFNEIAFKYDFLNRFLSAGIDISWRKKGISQLKELKPKMVLDVATGTADVALLTYKMLQPEKIVGIDISEGMLNIGRKKIADKDLQQIIQLEIGDSEQINYPDNSFDAITVAFGVRNFENLEVGLQNMLRVLKPKGKLVIIECTQPKQTAFKGFYKFYMNFITPSVGKMVAKNKKAYEYLNNSIQAFPEGETFLSIMQKAGFKNTYLKTLSLGLCTIYCGSK
jgi:demethylmenaquinone methyltransferase/2-methoxy-6-polyprenyl-1,4-benzoquinol methylase